MISYRLLPALLLVVQSLTGSAQDGQAGTPEANPTSSASIPAARSYTNETIGFSYPLLNGYVLNEDATKQYQLRPGTGTLFVADQVVNGRSCVNRIMAMADDTSHYHSPMRPETFATKLALSFTSNPAVKVTRGPYPTRMGDKVSHRLYEKALMRGDVSVIADPKSAELRGLFHGGCLFTERTRTITRLASSHFLPEIGIFVPGFHCASLPG